LPQSMAEQSGGTLEQPITFFCRFFPDYHSMLHQGSHSLRLMSASRVPEWG
jgi:hypothetical protein